MRGSDGRWEWKPEKMAMREARRLCFAGDGGFGWTGR